jgi:hypothetical protein
MCEVALEYALEVTGLFRVGELAGTRQVEVVEA